MDTQVEEIVQEVLKMNPEERKDLLTVAKFIMWRNRGGPKTDEISRGEMLYFWVKAHGDDEGSPTRDG
jgi:hypothetical protein